MTRPFAAAGTAYLFALLTASVCGYGASTLIFAVSAVIFSISLFFRKQIPFISTALGAVTLALFSFLFAYSSRVMPAEALDGSTLQLECTVESVSGRDKFSYVCSTEHEGHKFRFILNSQPVHMGLGEGDRIKGDFVLSKFPDDFRLGGKGNYLSKGIFMRAKAEDYEKLPASVDCGRFSGRIIRQHFARNLYASMPIDAAELTDAMLLGNMDSLPKGLFDDFSDAGVAHILVVSGMHLSILAEFIRRILCRFPISQRSVCIISSVFVLFFMFVTGFRYALLRAGIMTLVRILCQLPGRDSDGPSALGFAFLMICLPDPFAGGSTGFLLSACATMGIVLLPEPDISEKMSKGKTLRPVSRTMRKLLSPVFSALSVSLAATLGALPLTLLMGNEGTLYSVFSTVLLSVPASFIIGAGLVIAAAGPLFRWFLAPVIWLLTWFCRISADYCSLFRELPQLPLAAPAVIIPAVIFVFAFFMTTSARVKTAAVTCCCLVLLSSMIITTYDNRSSRIYYINDGEDYCAALAENGRASVFSTSGNSYKLESILRSKGYKIAETHRIGHDEEPADPTFPIISNPEKGRIICEIGGDHVIMDNNVSGKNKVTGQLAFVKYADGSADSGFTLLPESAIMNDTENLSRGRYVYGRNDTLYTIRLLDNNKISISCS